MDLNHLSSEVAKKAAMLSDDERLLIIRNDHWFSYERADYILNEMARLYHHPVVSRPPNILLVGESQSGKSSLISRFASGRNGSQSVIGQVLDHVPVLSISMPAECPKPKDFLHLLMIKSGTPFGDREKPGVLLERLIKVLQAIGTRVIMIDEFHHILNGSARESILLRDQIKLVSSGTRIPIVVAGLDTARNVFASDPQLQNRFKRIEIPRFLSSSSEDVVEVGKIVKKWFSECPLREASNSQESFSAVIHGIFRGTGGLIGHIIGYLKTASEYAITSGVEKINETVLQKMGWLTPEDAFPRYQDRSY